MTDQKSQEGSGGNKKNDEKPLRGFMAPLHEYLKKKYGPSCGFDPIANVFNMLEQQILGNWSVEDGIQLSRSFIAKQTGLTIYQVDKALKEMSQRKMIHIQQVCRIKPDGKKIWEESIYRLHPDKYGVDILWIDESNPKPIQKLQYIPGGKLVHKNVIPLMKKTEGGSMKNPQILNDPSLENRPNVNDPSSKKGMISNDPSLKNPQILNDQKTGQPLPERKEATDKSIKDSIRFSQEGGSMRDFEIDKQNWAEVRDYLVERHPGEEKQIDSIYRELQSKGVDDRGQAISCLPALMYSSYPSLKKARENPYAKPERTVVEEVIDEEAAGRARELVMKNFWSTHGRAKA